MRSGLLFAAWLCVAPACAATATAEPITVVVATSSGTPIADAVVALDPLDAAAPPPATALVATIDQVNKHFVPRVSVIRTGTAVMLPNSDQIRHQVYSFSTPHPFTLKLYAGRAAAPVVFEKPGMVVLGCNIHDTMVAYVAIVDTPYFGRTDPQGRVTVTAPNGRYRLRVWHPELTQAVAARTVALPLDSRTIEVRAELGGAPGAGPAWLD